MDNTNIKRYDEVYCQMGETGKRQIIGSTESSVQKGYLDSSQKKGGLSTSDRRKTRLVRSRLATSITTLVCLGAMFAINHKKSFGTFVTEALGSVKGCYVELILYGGR